MKSTTLKKSLLMGMSYAALTSMALAQDATDQGQDDSNLADLDIIVTVGKRPESVQDVSQSVTGLSSSAIDKAGITDVSRLDLVIPGVSFAFIGNDAKFNVRGSNSNNTFGDNASIVGVFADGVYKPRASQQTRQFYDVQRIEFLRGPQGTLYGRNTFSGALNLHTNKPDLNEYSGGVDVTYSRFNKLRSEGFINAPLAENFAIRMAGIKTTSDGYVENLAGRNLGADDKLGFRVSAYWEPTENVDMLVRYSIADEGGTSLGVFSYAGSCRPVNATGRTDAAGGLLDCVNPRRGSVGATPFDQLGPYQVEHDFVSEQDLKEHNVSMEINVDFGSANLKSITSYTDYDSLIGLDGDSSANPFERFWFEENAESYTQEFQLVSNNDSRFQWTTGAYASKDTVFFSFSDFRHTVDDGSGVPAGLLLATPLVSLDTNLNGHFASATEIESTYFGIFAQGEFSVTDELRVIGGLRYNNEKKSGVRGTNFSAASPIIIRNPDLSTGIIPSTPDPVFGYNLDVAGIDSSEKTYDNVSWRVGAEFDVNEDVMLYATASTGFLSGSINPSGTDTDEQKSRVIEAGIKSRFLDNTLQLNAAAHYTTYTNLLTQIQEVDPNTGNVVTTTRNGGDIEAYGLEVEAVYSPTDELRFSGNFAYLHSEYGVFGAGNLYQDYSGPLPINNGSINLSGVTTPWSPSFTANLNVSYVYDLGDNGTITPSVQFFYSDSYNAAGNLPIDPIGFVPSYTKTDLRIAWDSADGQYRVEAFVENIEDEAVNARVNVGGNDYAQTSYLYPRNYGVRLKARF